MKNFLSFCLRKKNSITPVLVFFCLVLPLSFSLAAAPARTDEKPPDLAPLQPAPEGVVPNVNKNVNAETYSDTTNSDSTEQETTSSEENSLTGYTQRGMMAFGEEMDSGLTQSVIGNIFIALLGLFLVFIGVYVFRKKYGKKE
jgi:hypothetical protein